MQKIFLLILINILLLLVLSFSLYAQRLDNIPVKRLPNGKIVFDNKKQTQVNQNIPGYARDEVKYHCGVNRALCLEECRMKKEGNNCNSTCESKYKECLSVLYK